MPWITRRRAPQGEGETKAKIKLKLQGGKQAAKDEEFDISDIDDDIDDVEFKSAGEIVRDGKGKGTLRSFGR